MPPSRSISIAFKSARPSFSISKTSRCSGRSLIAAKRRFNSSTPTKSWSIRGIRLPGRKIWSSRGESLSRLRHLRKHRLRWISLSICRRNGQSKGFLLLPLQKFLELEALTQARRASESDPITHELPGHANLRAS